MEAAAVEQGGDARTRIEHGLGKHRKGRELDTDRIENILLGPPASEQPPTMSSVQDSAARSGSGEARTDHRGPASRLAARNSSKSHPMLHVRMRPVEPRGKNQRT